MLTEPFDTLTKTALEFSDYGDVPRVILPRTLDNMTDDEIRGVADAYAEEILHCLVKEDVHPTVVQNPIGVLELERVSG